MKIFNLVSSMFIKFRKQITCIIVLIVVVTSIYWLRHLNWVLTTQSEWCNSQTETYPLTVCGGMFEREVERTYYLKIIMLSVLVLGSTGVLLIASEKNRE